MKSIYNKLKQLHGGATKIDTNKPPEIDTNKPPEFDISKFKFVEILKSSPDVIAVLYEENDTERKTNAIIVIKNDKFRIKRDMIPKMIPKLNFKFTKTNTQFNYGTASMDCEKRDFDIEIICPAFEKDILKHRDVQYEAVLETKKMYEEFKEDELGQQLKRLDWVWNIIKGRKEQESILLKNDHFVLMPNTKYNPEQDKITDLLYLVLVKNKELHSLRDLTRKDIPLLEFIKSKCITALLEKHKELKKEDLLFYVHYRPEYYQLHVHISHYKRKHTRSAERAHMLDTIIYNLAMSSDYYKNASILFLKKIPHKTT